MYDWFNAMNSNEINRITFYKICINVLNSKSRKHGLLRATAIDRRYFGKTRLSWAEQQRNFDR